MLVEYVNCVMVQHRAACQAPCHHTCRRPLEAVHAAAVEVVLPLFRAMVDAAESIILKLHEACTHSLQCVKLFSNDPAVYDTSCMPHCSVHHCQHRRTLTDTC